MIVDQNQVLKEGKYSLAGHSNNGLIQDLKSLLHWPVGSRGGSERQLFAGSGSQL